MPEINARLYNLDLLKCISIYFVILLHSLPLLEVADIYQGILLNFSRFAVPCFFIISGFLVGDRLINDKRYLVKSVKRIVLLFLCWNFIYFLVPLDIENIRELGFLKLKYWDFYQIVKRPVNTLFQGFYGHLWFLESLAWGFLYVYSFSQFNIKYTLSLSMLIYVFSVLAGGYSQTEIGFNLPFTSRNGPFVSAFFISLGWSLSCRKVMFSWQISLVFVFIGFFIQFYEYSFLTEQYSRAIQYEFLFGTPILSLGIFCLFLKVKNKQNWFAGFGKFSLGIYAIHIIVIDYLGYLFLNNVIVTYFGLFLMVSIVFLLSLCVSYLCSRYNYLRFLVL